MDNGAALSIISKRLKEEISIARNAFEGLNYIDCIYRRDEAVCRAIDDIITYIVFLENLRINPNDCGTIGGWVINENGQKVETE